VFVWKKEEIMRWYRLFILFLPSLLVFFVSCQLTLQPAYNPSPDNAAEVRLTEITLSWEYRGYGVTFDVFFGTSVETLQLIRSGLEISRTTVEGLSPDTVYYWKVRVNGDSGLSRMSELWSFKTLSRKYYALTIGVSRYCQMLWNKQNRAYPS